MSNVYDQFVASLTVTVSFSTPSAYSVNSTESGLIPSWSLLSCHTFVIVVVGIVSGVCAFVTVRPSAVFVYPVGTVFSFTV